MKKLLTLLLALLALSSCEQDPEIIGVDADKKLPKVDVCHYDADTDTWKTISVNANALKAHLKHGDYEGACASRTYVPDDAFEHYLIYQQYDDVLDNYVRTENIAYVEYIDIMDGVYVPNVFQGKVRDMTGIRDFASLKVLNVDSNELTELDVSGLEDLEMLDLSFNNVTKLNLKGLTSLELLFCSNNKLSELNLTGLSKLHYVEAPNNLLKSAIFTGTASLRDLSLSWNEFTELDVSEILNLEHLNVSTNKLDMLKANTGKTLKRIYADKNPDLLCIEVFDGIPPVDIDVNASLFSEDCGY